MRRISDEELEVAEKISEKATQENWKTDPYSVNGRINNVGPVYGYDFGSLEIDEEDADHVEQWDPPFALSMVAEVRRLKKLAEDLFNVASASPHSHNEDSVVVMKLASKEFLKADSCDSFPFGVCPFCGADVCSELDFDDEGNDTGPWFDCSNCDWSGSVANVKEERTCSNCCHQELWKQRIEEGYGRGHEPCTTCLYGKDLPHWTR